MGADKIKTKIVSVQAYAPFIISSLVVWLVYRMREDLESQIPSLHPLALYSNLETELFLTHGLGGKHSPENIIGQLLLAFVAFATSLTVFEASVLDDASSAFSSTISSLNVEKKPLLKLNGMRRSSHVVQGRMLV